MKPPSFLVIAACAPLAMAQGQTCSARSGDHDTAGENSGEKLARDHVVRELHEVPPWTGARIRLQFSPAARPDAAHPRALNLVVIDPATGRPLQALRLRC